MTEEKEKLPRNMLTAEELLKNKGIRCIAWNEYERSHNVLPKTGKKHFEPTGSWLQNMQIEKGLNNRKELLSIERVERSSQLATAEWLPAQKKARVKKYSGQDWSNFGLEKNSALYLIPEEALFLLEANCLELMWNNVPLSIQQAYELLIDNVECTLEEYMVYSQLARFGYRIKRYVYEYSEREESTTKRKVIVDPENGLRMTDSQQQTQNSKTVNNEETVKEVQDCQEISISDSDTDTCQDVSAPSETGIKEDVCKVIEDLVTSVESLNESGMELCSESNTNLPAVTLNGDKQKRTSKDTKAKSPRSWRIQRNVKIVPKRKDKPSTSDVLIHESNRKGVEQHCLEKRKALPIFDEQMESKKARHEVIELSDDEIQELPKPVSRMDLLNLIPNIASKRTVTAKISRPYIPQSIKPQGNIYYYETARLRNLHAADRNQRSRCNSYNNYSHHVMPYNNTARNEFMRWNSNPYMHTSQMNMNVHVFMRALYPFVRAPYVHFIPPYFYNRFCNRSPYGYTQNAHPRTPTHHDNEIYQPSFKTIPGTSSWSELKTKWREEKTITIDDEDPTNKENPDCNEVQVVKQSTSPLIGPNKVGSLAEAFERLKIIKPAPEKTVRRRKSRCKISYDIYSNTQHYAKANPGPPLYRVVVRRQKDDPFLQPIELHRLQRDAKDSPIVLACVSMSISYIQLGFISVPNIT